MKVLLPSHDALRRLGFEPCACGSLTICIQALTELDVEATARAGGIEQYRKLGIEKTHCVGCGRSLVMHPPGAKS